VLATQVIMRLHGIVNPEVWNRIGVKLLPKLRNGRQLQLGIDFSWQVEQGEVVSIQAEIQQALTDLQLTERVRISVE